MIALAIVLSIVLFIALIVGAVILAVRAARQRRDELAALAAKLGLTFSEARDHALAKRLGFLDKLNQGSNRYSYNRLSGGWQGHEVMAFEYHYETYSHSSKGGRQTHHHYLTIFTLLLPKSFPELLISREGLFSKLAQALGYDDIDFESAEFSRTFCVRSRDKKFAYDVCHPQMMEYLLARQDLAVEIEGNVLALAFDSRLDVPQIEPRLRQLVEIRRLMPDYLFTKT
jgi:hypothetical protein